MTVVLSGCSRTDSGAVAVCVAMRVCSVTVRVDMARIVAPVYIPGDGFMIPGCTATVDPGCIFVAPRWIIVPSICSSTVTSG